MPHLKISIKSVLDKKIKEHNHHYVLETFWLGNDYQDQNSRYFLFHKFFLDYTI